jgi:hypothetical protein
VGAANGARERSAASARRSSATRSAGAVAPISPGRRSISREPPTAATRSRRRPAGSSTIPAAAAATSRQISRTGTLDPAGWPSTEARSILLGAPPAPVRAPGPPARRELRPDTPVAADGAADVGGSQAADETSRSLAGTTIAAGVAGHPLRARDRSATSAPRFEPTLARGAHAYDPRHRAGALGR